MRQEREFRSIEPWISQEEGGNLMSKRETTAAEVEKSYPSALATVRAIYTIDWDTSCMTCIGSLRQTAV